MSKLAEIIDRLESDIFIIIDDIQFQEHCEGSELQELREELDSKRKELIKIKYVFDKECDYLATGRL
jgi:hypothetical protein